MKKKLTAKKIFSDNAFERITLNLCNKEAGFLTKLFNTTRQEGKSDTIKRIQEWAKGWNGEYFLDDLNQFLKTL